MDILEAAVNAQIETDEVKGRLLIDAITSQNPNMVDYVFKLIDPNEPKSRTIHFQAHANSEEERDDDGMTPLHFAVQKGNLSAVQRLLERKASIRFVTNSHTSVFHLACRVGAFEILSKLIKYAAEQGLKPATILNTHDKRGFTCVHEAASHGQFKVIRYLATVEGVEFDVKTITGRSAADLAFDKDAGVLWEFLKKRLSS